MEEMMDDMLGDMDDDEELEEEADAEVDKILYDLTDGKLGLAGSVGTGLPVSNVRQSHLCCDINIFYRNNRSRTKSRKEWNNIDSSSMVY